MVQAASPNPAPWANTDRHDPYSCDQDGHCGACNPDAVPCAIGNVNANPSPHAKANDSTSANTAGRSKQRDAQGASQERLRWMSHWTDGLLAYTGRSQHQGAFPVRPLPGVR
jgi:hypothetical protein